MKTYKFESYDDEDNTRTVVEFTTDNDAWSGYDGPMYQFFNFLKGQGFLFDVGSEIGVIDNDGDFRAAAED